MKKYYRRRSLPRLRMSSYSKPRSRSYSRPRSRSHHKIRPNKYTALIFAAIIGAVVISKITASTATFLAENAWLLIIALAIPSIVLIGYVIYSLINKKYECFIREHSVAIQKLLEINSRYRFEEIPCLDMTHSYDNENFYADISPLDYLTYQLAYYQKNNALRAIDAAAANANIFPDYLRNVEQITEFDKYNTDSLPILKKFRKSKEQKIFKDTIIKPLTQLTIKVTLESTNINGAYKDSKTAVFSANNIKHVIERASQKNGDFFVNEDIWQSICRVERGKVSNKMRFAIYQRDGNRCRRCGSRYDLEVDHIFPISKGGKSTMDNLQTLCHSCNSAKSNTIEAGVVNPAARRSATGKFCARCGAPMVKRNGPNGSFYGCPNYPKCTFTMQIR